MRETLYIMIQNYVKKKNVFKVQNNTYSRLEFLLKGGRRKTYTCKITILILADA